MLETIQKMYEHLIWANKRILATLHNIKEDQQDVIRLFSHILFSEIIWMARLQGIDSSKLPIWAEVDLEFCDELVKKNEETIISFLLISSKEDLEKTITYKNSSGIEFKNTIREILTHVSLHGHYHRGQINTRFRSIGAEPVILDFIHYVRT